MSRDKREETGDRHSVIIDRAGLPADELTELDAEVAAMTTLQDVVRWTLHGGHEVVEVVVQDEYSHDVVVSWRGGRYLVFDTT